MAGRVEERADPARRIPSGTAPEPAPVHRRTSALSERVEVDGVVRVHTGEDVRVPRLLVVHHTPSPAMQALLEAVREGVALVEEVELVVRPALSAGAADLLDADGVLLGTPANIGYMSGALKHFFDTVYYPCLDATVGRPYGVYVHGNDDTAGALAGIERITGALRWKQVAAPLSLVGAPRAKDLEACRELAATVAVQL
jgi:hypothetical protein